MTYICFHLGMCSAHPLHASSPRASLLLKGIILSWESHKQKTMNQGATLNVKLCPVLKQGLTSLLFLTHLISEFSDGAFQ